MPEKICSKCHKHFSASQHQSGLVFNDRLFVCEDCIEDTPEAEFERWVSVKIEESTVGMPIGLWLIHEQNKDKQLFIQSKKE